MEPKPKPRQESHAAELLVQAVAVGLVVAANTYTIWLSLPPQQRYWIRLRVTDTFRSLTARLAWREGHAGMGEELKTGRRSVRYLGAWGLGLLRDAAVGELERLKP